MLVHGKEMLEVAWDKGYGYEDPQVRGDMALPRIKTKYRKVVVLDGTGEAEKRVKSKGWNTIRADC